MNKFKVGDRVVVVAGDYSDTCWVEDMDLYIGKTLTILTAYEEDDYFCSTYEVYGALWVFPEECFKLVESSTVPKKHTYTGEWISIDEELPPFGVEVFLDLPEETPKRQKGSLKYIGEDGPIFKKSGQTNPFSTANNFPKIVGRVVMWTEAPSLPE